MTEELVGICGSNTGLDDMPDSAPGVLQPPPTPRVPELLLAAAAKKIAAEQHAVFICHIYIFSMKFCIAQ